MVRGYDIQRKKEEDRTVRLKKILSFSRMYAVP